MDHHIDTWNIQFRVPSMRVRNEPNFQSSITILRNKLVRDRLERNQIIAADVNPDHPLSITVRMAASFLMRMVFIESDWVHIFKWRGDWLPPGSHANLNLFRNSGIYGAGKQESLQIRRAIVNEGVNRLTLGHRGEIFKALTSLAGQQMWSGQMATEQASERRFHEWLHATANVALAELLVAIDAYERFCRYLQDAWEDCLRFMTLHKQRVKAIELAGLKSIAEAAAMLPDAYAKVV